MTTASVTFHTLVERDDEGDVALQLGSSYRNRDVRAYTDIGIARRNRTRFANESGKNIRVLTITVYFDGQLEWHWD